LLFTFPPTLWEPWKVDTDIPWDEVKQIVTLFKQTQKLFKIATSGTST
jgi:hypothetical protein